MDRCQRLIPLLLIMLLAACNQAADWGVSAQAAPTGTSGATATPPCTLMPLPTGEGFFPHLFMQAPPDRVRAGQTVYIEFEAGIIVGSVEQTCGGETQILQPNPATATAMTRSVEVRLDDKLIARTECGYHCGLSLTIPINTSPGRYTLRFVTSYIQPAEFTLQVEQLLLLTC